MFQLLQSIWLWAIAAIVVPVIIHLWNVKKGKTLKVGSIALLSESAKSKAASIKVSEWLLLLLRCLMLIALALVLTKPFWQKQLNAGRIKGWIMLDKDHLKEGYEAFQKEIDSLARSGYSFHYLEDDFKEFNLQDDLNVVDTAKKPAKHYWSLISRLNQQLPATIPVYLYTNNNQQYFTGVRPTVDLNLHWKTFASKDTVAHWLQDAWLTNDDDSIRVITGKSNNRETRFEQQTISKFVGNSNFTISMEQDKTMVSLNTQAGAPKQSLQVDETTSTIIIYGGKVNVDARYLQAALDAIKDVGERKLNTILVSNTSSIPNNYNWLFWLSGDTIPGTLKKENIFKYEHGILKKQSTPLVVASETELTAIQPIEQYQFIITDNKNPQAIPVWKNGFGESILSKEGDKPLLYRFYSRFNPQWSDLVWSSEFPGLIHNILFPGIDNTQINERDKRVLDTRQIMPSVAKGHTVKQAMLSTKDLTKILWLLAFLFFASERLLSHYSRKTMVV
ncbi:MAG: BatA domain-containing protein [Bacteroidota bacterium]